MSDDVGRLRRAAQRRHAAGRVGLYALALLAAFGAAGPFVWAAITAFNSLSALLEPV